MNLRDCKFLADENIHPEVVEAFRSEGVNVIGVLEAGWAGKADNVLLHMATEQDRVVLTHDRDFGTLAIAEREPYFGIVYVRPGHIRAEFTLEMLRHLFAQKLQLPKPFIVVVQRSRDQIKVRVRGSSADEISS